MIPGPTSDWAAIQEFALSFDGYDANGSFQNCAEIANARKHETLSDLRTCLFFEQRRWNHFGEQPDSRTMHYIRFLIGEIRRRVEAAGRSAT